MFLNADINKIAFLGTHGLSYLEWQFRSVPGEADSVWPLLQSCVPEVCSIPQWGTRDPEAWMSFLCAAFTVAGRRWVSHPGFLAAPQLLFTSFSIWCDFIMSEERKHDIDQKISVCDWFIVVKIKGRLAAPAPSRVWKDSILLTM